ncbi:repetitive organellar protein-like [Atheta coriaria]|uniref:repetitive organellar protein-like n=1 Tax=Dalotia coriaria TaxID=877792 RepID=UPI0031F46303
MREINALSSQIEESEYYVRDVLIKYIQDKSVLKEVLNAVTFHKRLLEDIEKRSNDLTNEHWIQQVENYKNKEKTLESSMNSIIHQNRELLEENELLTRKNEKLSAAMLCLQESGGNTLNKTQTSSKCILEDLSKNNDRLRQKVNGIMSQVGSMEETVKKFQKKCQFLQQQLNNSNNQLHNTKAFFEKSKIEYEMHVAKLSNELHSVSSIVKDSTDQSNIIMQDLEMLKMQLQPIATSINWDKFRKCVRPLPEMINIHRTCINELSSALIYKQKELNLASSENETLKLSSSNHEPLKDRIQQLCSQLEESLKEEKSLKEDIDSLKHEILTKEQNIESLQSVIADKDNEIDVKVNLLNESADKINELNDQLANAKTEYNQLLFNTEKYRHENNALHMQVKGMAQVLTATGAGDIAKELANSQEKLTAIQTQFLL